MSATELQQLAEAIGRQGVDFPWYAYIGAIAVALSSAFFVNYLMNKAAIRASNENFNTLNEQLKKNTRDTEEIKAALSGSAWLTQQQWGFREKYYVALLTQLNRLNVSLIDQSEFYLEPGSEHDVSIVNNPRFEELSRVERVALQEIREIMGPASLFLADAAIRSLEELIKKQWHIAYDSHPEEYLTKTLPLVEEAMNQVRAEAKKELAHWQAAGPPNSN